MAGKPIVPLRQAAADRAVRSLEYSRLPVLGRWLVLGAVYIATILLVSPFLFERIVDPDRDTELPRAIVAKVDFVWENPAIVERENRLAEENHERHYEYSEPAELSNVKQLEDRLTKLDFESSKPEELGKARANIQEAFGSAPWAGEDLPVLLALADDQTYRRIVNDTVRRLLDRYYLASNSRLLELHIDEGRAQFGPPKKSERSGELKYERQNILGYDEFRERARRMLRLAFASSRIDPVAALEPTLNLIEHTLKPTLVADTARTVEALRSYPRASARETIPKGAVIVDRGRRMKPEDFAKWSAYRKQLEGIRAERIVSHVGFVTLVFAVLFFYVRKFSRQISFTVGNILLLSLPMLLALAIQFFFVIVMFQDRPPPGLFPAGMIGMLGVLLLDIRAALLLVTWSCLLFGLQTEQGYEHLVTALFGGYAAVAALHGIRERREVLKAGAIVGIVNALVLLLLLRNDETVWQFASIGFVGGITCALLTLAALPVFEIALDITTDLRLLELSGPDVPLLQKLEDEAPGTWQHSLNVAKLAEGAAAEIGANVLLVRVGCLYHDIGKMSKPEYFTENQVTAQDKIRHNLLKPQISTLIIKNHVKEGIELSRKYRLPRRVADFIPQHHGTSLITYFYHKALAAHERGESKEPVRPEDYRYPGPKPQSIEAAIVMLADSVEATSTAKLTGRSVREDDIRQLVRNTVTEKFDDGQFDECNLTMRDLNVIRESFVNTLRSRFHTRIDYPSATASAQAARERAFAAATERGG